MPNYLLSQLQVININPGEQAQLMQADDGFYPIPRPRQVLSIATIWAIDEFTAINGATLVIPGSHRWGDDRLPKPSDVRRPGYSIHPPSWAASTVCTPCACSTTRSAR
jgi:ectoine hydroxylase-related dioxygenase (phytanoyl-CoA dioxygenase family)